MITLLAVKAALVRVWAWLRSWGAWLLAGLASVLAFIFYCISRKPKPEPVPTDVQKDAEQQAAQQNVLVEQQAAAQVSAANTQAKDAWDTALRDAQSRAADADSTNPFLDDVSKKMRQ